MNTTALLFALGTVFCWGLYSVLLHKGSLLMSAGVTGDMTGARMKAFLMVGIAYFIVGIVGPVLIMKARGFPLTVASFPMGGMWWSLLAGLAGAIGAYFLLMALSAGKGPLESKSLVLLVPAIVFAGAPIVNAVVALSKDGLWGDTPWQFYAGILLASAGVAMVMKYRPLGHAAPPPKAAGAPAAAVIQPARGPAPVAVVTAPPPMASGYADVTTRTWFVS
jgi:hypothetical protein